MLGELVGAYSSLVRGSGIEYEEIRPYVPGDDPRAIAWQKNRGTQLFVKTFRQERDLRVNLFLDVSASMLLRQGKEIASLLVLAAQAARDRVAVGLFSDRLHELIPNRAGLRHGLKLLEVIEMAVPQQRPSSLGNVITGFLRTKPRKSLVIFVTDGAFLQQEYEVPLKKLAALHDVLVIKVSQAVKIPDINIGVVRFKDAESGMSYCTDISEEALRTFREALQKVVVEFQEKLRKSHVDYQEVEPQDDAMKTLFALFARRGRRRAR